MPGYLSWIKDAYRGYRTGNYSQVSRMVFARKHSLYQISGCSPDSLAEL